MTLHVNDDELLAAIDACNAALRSHCVVRAGKRARKAQRRQAVSMAVLLALLVGAWVWVF